MNYRSLGSTGIRVSEIGFGAWGIGGNVGGSIAYGPTDDDTSRAALRRAFELGVTFFDTADFYGFGHSEELIGETLGGVRDQLVLATKAGLVDRDGTQDFSPAHLRAALAGSLRRLCTDYVDVYQLHSPSLDILREGPEVLATLQALQQEGKTRTIGISLRGTADGAAAIQQFGFACLQVNLNLLDQRPIENGLLDLCRQANVGVIARTPLSFGFLTGQYSVGDKFAESDHRRKWSTDQIARWTEGAALFAQLRDRHPGQTVTQLALRFCISHPAVSTTIPGMLNPAHVEENVAASGLGPLDEQDLAQAARLYRSHEFFAGQRGPLG
ncbi:MAG: aldo/keto reductase [Kiritimatiellae bacterium]|nr:aldo/keto reductase [Kiritimatiellia bacterium]